MKIPEILSRFSGKQSQVVLFVAGCIEFSLAGVFSLRLEPDPKNAFLFGYSMPRLALFGLSILFGLGMLIFACSSGLRSRVMVRLEAGVQKAPMVFALIVLLLAGLGIMIGLMPSAALGKFGLYFSRLRLFLFVFCLMPAQFSLYWLKPGHWQGDRALLRIFMIWLLALGSVVGLILLSGWGLTPEGILWGPVGTPLTGLQLSLVFWVGLLLFGVFGFLKDRVSNNTVKIFDLLVVVCLFAGALTIWMDLPSPRNEFSYRPLEPYLQAFPNSDAAVHDVGGLSILNGSGIFFGQYTDKPLYMVFLAFLHLLGGNDYNLLALLHAAFMALMLPGLYFFGKSFHSRMFGFLLASGVALRQYNAIYLSNHLYYNATVRQFLTEVPTLLGIVLFTWAFFAWVRSPERAGWRAFFTGGILGVITLIRLNPSLLILAVPVFIFFSNFRNRQFWLKQALLFLLGCSLVITPWLLTGRDATGTPYFLVKFYDIIDVRYGPSGALPFENSVAGAPAEPAALTVMSAGVDMPPLSIKTFPGFVINHSLHNLVTAFLTLPDSILVVDQTLTVLTERPYWTGKTLSVALRQIPFLILNLVLLAFGLGWAWQRWRWAGMVPLFVFIVYSGSLGLGRTSGSRYIVPVDWVVYFYFILGLLCMLPAAFKRFFAVGSQDDTPVTPVVSPASTWMRLGMVTILVCVAGSVPAAQYLFPPLPCGPEENFDSLVQGLISQGAPPQFNLFYGEIIYPEVRKDHLSFSLLTCRNVLYFDLYDFRGKLAIGQRVLAGLTDTSLHPGLYFVALEDTDKGSAKMIWQAH